MNTNEINSKIEHIIWPQGIDPDKYPARSYNSLWIAKTPEVIWNKIIQAGNWPQWYANCQWMEPQTTLSANRIFAWKTFHLNVVSQVIEFKPFESIGWDAKEFMAHGYHGWRLIPKDNGTLVVTEEVQGGFGPTLLAPFVSKGLHTQHQKWLEGMSA